MKKETKGWKVFDENLKCRDFQFEVGKRYKQDGAPKLCSHGYHFHEVASHLFNYYSFNPKNRVCEIIAYGDCDKGDDKTCCNEIELIRELTWHQVLDLINIGVCNTGINNTGHRNSGDQNSGDQNSGDQNSGHRNSGDQNSGDQNTGHWNSGHRNSGDQNSGHRNSGDQNSGDWNSGDQNSGHRNSGDQNSGHRNSGDQNSGDWNSGDQNSGDQNSGHRNSGDQNSGDFNATNYSSGIFNTIEPPVPLFNGAVTVLMSEFKETDNYKALFSSSFPLTKWISESNMTEQEKVDNPKFYVAEGYLKKRSYKEACSIWWENMTDKNKQLVKEMPGFTASIFTEVTGIEL